MRQYDPSIFLLHDEDGIHGYRFKNTTEISDDTEVEVETDEMEEVGVPVDLIPDTEKPDQPAPVDPDDPTPPIDGDGDGVPVFAIIAPILVVVGIIIGYCCYKKR